MAKHALVLKWWMFLNVACMDFSGNYMFLGVVIGGRSVLERFYTHLSGKYGVIHARRLGKLRFSVLKDILSKNLMFYCLYVDMNLSLIHI